MAISHKVKFTQCVVFDPARHATGNLPQCAFCHHKFDTWHALKQHIQRLNCPILMQQVGLTGAVATGASLRPSVAGKQPGHDHEDPDIQACVGENGWKALLDSPHAQHFRQHCSLCNRWIKDPTALKRHLKQTHGDLWDFVAPELEAKCAEVKHQLPRDGTCPWCERTSYSRHYHQCNVIFQSALLGLLHGRQRDGRLRELATGPSGSTRTTGDNGSEAAPREQLSGRTTKQEGQANKTGRQGSRPRPPPQPDRERSDHAGVHSEGAGGRLDGPIQPHKSSPRSAPPLCPITVRPVASQRMRNLSNTCYIGYINSLTFTILWQVQQRVDINVPEAWQRAQAQGTWTPANVLRFTMLGWRQPDQQHDVVEFMQFLLPRIPWLGSAFMWGARLIDRGGIVRHIHQPNAHVLPLDPPDGMCDSNLQNTINAWHQQYAIHGLCQAPTHLYIQLPRYRETPQGFVKHSIPLNLNTRDISLPVFTHPDALEVRWQAYRITTAIVHLGPNRQQGHYRAAAFLPGQSRLWYSDDNQAAVEMSHIPAQVSEQCYVLGCMLR